MLTWEAIEDRALDLLVLAFEAGFAAASGRLALTPDDPAILALLEETRRRWQDGMETWQAEQAADAIPDWLRVAQQDQA